jgi:hypothetical protein
MGEVSFAIEENYSVVLNEMLRHNKCWQTLSALNSLNQSRQALQMQKRLLVFMEAADHTFGLPLSEDTVVDIRRIVLPLSLDGISAPGDG